MIYELSRVEAVSPEEILVRALRVDPDATLHKDEQKHLFLTAKMDWETVIRMYPEFVVGVSHQGGAK